MARQKSPDKRNAILDAAVAVFAERGVWTTPTSAISRAAGVAEGTLFTYFSTKEELVNELYRVLKHEFADVMVADFPTDADTRTIFATIWQRYVAWGIARPARLKVMMQLSVSDQISEEAKRAAYAPLAQIEQAALRGVVQQEMVDYPQPFLVAMFDSMATTTMAFIANNPGDPTDYSALGFELFWKAISAR